MNTHLLHLENVTKTFNQGRPNEYSALRGISLDIPAYQATCIIGPSGSGKTTLLSTIACLARPTAGRIYLREKPISNLPENFLAKIRRSTFGFIFQRFNLISGLTVLENIVLPAYPLGLPQHKLLQRAFALLDQFDLKNRAEHRVEWLSGGEAQRTAICRALINDPAIVIADEPSANLDSALTAELLEIFTQLRAAGKTLLITSHDPIIHEAAAIDMRVEMRDGEVRSIA